MSKLSMITTNNPDGSEEVDNAACGRSACNDVSPYKDAGCCAPLAAVYFLNAPDNDSAVIAMTGHAALLLVSTTYGLELYNFGPFDNKSAFAQGAIAQTVDRVDSFASFVARCAANDFEGIEIQNGYTQWHEPYKRAIKLCVTDNQLTKIREYVQVIKAQPPRFNFFAGYSCSNFCCAALKCADIYFVDARGREIKHAYPNHIYPRAVGAFNVQAFEKIDFRELSCC